jgi:hypothetical protein
VQATGDPSAKDGDMHSMRRGRLTGSVWACLIGMLGLADTVADEIAARSLA